jgi:hypothetical protein
LKTYCHNKSRYHWRVCQSQLTSELASCLYVVSQIYSSTFKHLIISCQKTNRNNHKYNKKTAQIVIIQNPIVADVFVQKNEEFWVNPWGLYHFQGKIFLFLF